MRRRPAWRDPRAKDEPQGQGPSPREALGEEHLGPLSALGEDRMGRGPAILCKTITVYQASRRHVVFLTEGAAAD